LGSVGTCDPIRRPFAGDQRRIQRARNLPTHWDDKAAQACN
jgi:hypothetical protein